MKAQQRRGPDGDRDFQHALRRNEHRAQAQQDSDQCAERRRLHSRSVQNQQLMLQKARFGDDCAGTGRGHGPDRRDNEMSHQGEPIPQAANNDWGCLRSQDYGSVLNCGRLAIRHGQAANTTTPTVRSKRRHHQPLARRLEEECHLLGFTK